MSDLTGIGLPREISPDGKEIWDWATRLSKRVHTVQRLREIDADLAGIRAGRCGDCDHWMKSRECPREANANGMSRGPSMNAPKCGEYVAKAWVLERKGKLEAERGEVMKKLETRP